MKKFHDLRNPEDAKARRAAGGWGRGMSSAVAARIEES
jgi:hypothetical protein